VNLDELIHRIMDFLPHFLAALPLAIAVMVGAFLVNLLLGRALLLLAHRTHLTEMDVVPVRKILRWIVRLIAAVFVLSVFGFEIGGVWTVMSTILGLVAIGFVAVWSLISHTTATILILFLHPFQMGDDLEFPGEPIQGRAVNLNFFFTTLIDHRGTLHQIPNNLFFQKAIKRIRHTPPISLAAQLNSRDPVEVELPPAPDAHKDSGKVKEPDPMMNLPDPRSITPPGRPKF
jgi:small-conductance mechanosensitive channel